MTTVTRWRIFAGIGALLWVGACGDSDPASSSGDEPDTISAADVDTEDFADDSALPDASPDTGEDDADTEDNVDTADDADGVDTVDDGDTDDGCVSLGCPCLDDDDCRSGYCIEDTEDGQIWSIPQVLRLGDYFPYTWRVRLHDGRLEEQATYGRRFRD